MNTTQLIKSLGFTPKENALDIYAKKFSNNYTIEINLKKQNFYFGGKIKVGEKDFQNITKPEDWVVLECVNRLLDTGYKPENIILEKVYPAGHGYSGRLDICVYNEDGSEYLLIECKTYGKQFDKALARLNKDGGQLFTYFKFSNKADLIMLYSSELKENEVIFKNEVIKIEDKYRTGDVKDFFSSWNKQTYQNIVWQNPPYNSQPKKKFTKNDLVELTEEVSDTLFHGFASILRKHSVSDKPNAFNKIFNLFLAKLYDEAKRDEDPLEFHWREDDNAVDFQVRLIDLHKKGLFDFLQKEIEGIDTSDFQAKTPEEIFEKKKKYLKFNNIFAIKDVLNDADFDENQRVLKEVVQLLENYRIRYPRKQQHLSNFFERLLTTGLKQEVGQYFTPPPITKFIIRSLPLPKMLEQEINNEVPKLPAIIDYAAGSGHFITEALEEYQDIINNISTKGFFPKAINAVKGWQEDPYEWAAKYVYGIEKDYRLVKVAKVGCYFYGDGVAQIIHGDGLDSFKTSKTYKGLLKENTNLDDSSKAKFSIVVSNPPYAVNDCKDDLEYLNAQHEFTLYNNLTDKSKEIECLFVERTKHLLKDGGVASLILPSSILNNTGIQTKTREIILQYFDIVAIAEFGSNTFMATGTNTVTLFLRRRSNKLSEEWKKSVAIVFATFEDNSINGINKPVSKYINHVWGGITFSDYTSLLKKEPNQQICEHEIYIEYRKKIKAKNENEFWTKLLETEKEKLLYFIIAYNQKVVVVKSGEKEEEKRFLGYEFSNRRGSEGMHSMQRSKTIDDSTQLYNANNLLDPTKASTYIYKAFEDSNATIDVDAAMQKNVSQHNLVDMLTFDRVEFEKNISLSVKKKIRIESKWEIVRVSEICEIGRGRVINKREIEEKFGEYPVFSSQTSNNGIFGYLKSFDFEGEYVTWTTDGIYAGSVFYRNGRFNCTNVCGTLKSKSDKINMQFLSVCLPLYTNAYVVRVANPKLMNNVMASIQIPLPPLNIQQKIVDEIEVLEKQEKEAKAEVEKLKEDIEKIISKVSNNLTKLSEITLKIGSGATPLGGESAYQQSGITLIRSQNVYDNEFYEKGLVFIDEEQAEKLKGVTVEKDDILFNITGASITRCCIVPNEYLPARVNQHVSIIRVNSKALPKYIQSILVSATYKKQLLDIGDGATSREAITKQQLEEFKVPLPSLKEQQKIVSEIEKIEEKIKKLESEIATIPAQKEAILKKYL